MRCLRIRQYLKHVKITERLAGQQSASYKEFGEHHNVELLE